MNTTKDMKLIDIDKLIPYINNARTHTPEQIKKLRGSLREFGFINPVIIDKDLNVIAGHGRILAAKEEGIKEVPCVLVDYLTEAQKKAYILADNRMALDAGWDEEILKAELEALNEEAFDLSLTGFDESELSDLFGADEDVKEDDFDVDAELEKPCVSQAGDVWHIGRHTVICGDTTDPETYRKLLGDTKVNLVLTDAPYFVDLSSASGKIRNDDLDDKSAYEFLMKAFENFKEAMAKDASIYEFYATSKSRIFFDAFDDAGFKLGAGLIWKKDRAPLMRTDWKFDFEPIMFGWRKDGKHIWKGDQKQKACIDGFGSIKNSKEEGFGHPSSKPVQLIAYLMKQSSDTNGLVLDGFLGSASTLIAAEQTGRTCYGIEIEPKYVDVACARYVKLTSCKSDDVYVERDGKRYTFADLSKELEAADE